MSHNIATLPAIVNVTTISPNIPAIHADLQATAQCLETLHTNVSIYSGMYVASKLASDSEERRETFTNFKTFKMSVEIWRISPVVRYSDYFLDLLKATTKSHHLRLSHSVSPCGRGTEWRAQNIVKLMSCVFMRYDTMAVQYHPKCPCLTCNLSSLSFRFLGHSSLHLYKCMYREKKLEIGAESVNRRSSIIFIQ